MIALCSASVNAGPSPSPLSRDVEPRGMTREIWARTDPRTRRDSCDFFELSRAKKPQRALSELLFELFQTFVIETTIGSKSRI